MIVVSYPTSIYDIWSFWTEQLNFQGRARDPGEGQTRPLRRGDYATDREVGER